MADIAKLKAQLREKELASMSKEQLEAEIAKQEKASRPIGYESNKILACQYDKPGMMCADVNGEIKSAVPREVCSPGGIQIVKRDAALARKINNRYYVMLYFSLACAVLGFLLGIVLYTEPLEWLLNGVFGLLIGIVIAVGLYLLYLFFGWLAFGTSITKVRDEKECERPQNLSNYTKAYLTHATAASSAKPSVYDIYVAGEATGNAINFKNAGHIQAEHGISIGSIITNIDKKLTKTKWIVPAMFVTNAVAGSTGGAVITGAAMYDNMKGAELLASKETFKSEAYSDAKITLTKSL